ncbi:MAG: ferredoxin family protein [Halobacteriota archaeon]|nr:ferredoxin family protein [Halobacteriota archaeon]
MKRINEDYCKGCNLCVDICPKDVYSEGREVSKRGYKVPIIKNIDECLDFKRMKEGSEPRCSLCELSCPDQAISPIKVSDIDE